MNASEFSIPQGTQVILTELPAHTDLGIKGFWLTPPFGTEQWSRGRVLVVLSNYEGPARLERLPHVVSGQ